MVEQTKEHFQALGHKDIVKTTKLTADSGFYNTANVTYLYENGIDVICRISAFASATRALPRLSVIAPGTRKTSRRTTGERRNTILRRTFIMMSDAHLHLSCGQEALPERAQTVQPADRGRGTRIYEFL